jgi:hypothetical protein
LQPQNLRQEGAKDMEKAEMGAGRYKGASKSYCREHYYVECVPRETCQVIFSFSWVSTAELNPLS